MWPNTPIRNMIDGSTYWDATLGNAIQSAINNISTQQASLAGAVLDGIGGQAKTARSAITALLRAEDGASHARGIVDYLGFRTGPVIELYDSLQGNGGYPGGVTSVSTILQGSPLGWMCTKATTNFTNQVNTATSVFAGTWNPGFNSSRTASDSLLFTSGGFYNGSSGTAFDQQVCVFEWGFAIDSTSLAAMDIYVGLGPQFNNTPFTPGTSGGFLVLRFAPGGFSDTTFKLVSYNGATTTTVDTGIAPAANTAYRIRLEMHRASTPLGTLGRVFINGAPSSTTATLPIAVSGGTRFGLCVQALSRGTGGIVSLGLAYAKIFMLPYGLVPGGATTSDV